MNMILKNSEAISQNLGGGVSRRVLAYTKNLMIVEVTFSAGSVGEVHSHPHFQNSYILSGKFLFTVGDEKIEVGPGDSLAFEANVKHGALCLEAGKLLDIFTPMREDFV